MPSRGIVPPTGDTSTLFVTATVQVWRDWVLSRADMGTGRLAGLQWCVRMKAIDSVGDSHFLTSFLMAGEAVAGPIERVAIFSRVQALIGERLGLPTSRLVYLLNGEHPEHAADTTSAEALRNLGVQPARIVFRPRRWATPFKPGPTGPSVFVLLDTGRCCGPGCAPLCTCGRYLQIWHLVFLERESDGAGGFAPRARPVVDGAASIEWLDAAASGTFDVYESVALRGLWHQLRDAISDEPAARLVTDHCRTIALLAGSGIRPSGRGHGQVLRRLVSRACAAVDASGADRRIVAAGAVQAAATCVGLGGFPPLDTDARRALDAELVAYGRRVEDARRRYRRRIRSCQSEQATARLVFELKTSGAPLATLARWLEADGVALPADQLDRLQSAERERSRALS